MPIYDYKCTKCNKIFEFTQKFSEKPKTECPNCKTETLEKQLSVSSFIVKGSNYSNGYK